jgi:hypothetical protein
VFAARVLEDGLADLHGPAGLIALIPAVALYTAGAVYLVIAWVEHRTTMGRVVTLAALAPTAVLVVLALRTGWLMATSG